jgi:ubiquinone/menaquinone biosynthesis C-methylase UbiE
MPVIWRMSKLNSISDDEWFALLCREGYDPELNNFVSDMPAEEIQLKFTGASGKVTLTPAFEFYKLVRSFARKCSSDSGGNILDFGCGWGRITRFFVRDVREGHLFGIDPLPEMIEICDATVRHASFSVIDPLPPALRFTSGMFDIIYAYSVFSHLNEWYACSWFREFDRLLKRKGLLVVTTRSRSFIEHTAQLRKSAAASNHPPSSVQAFVDTRQVLSEYDCGKYCHEPTGGGDKLSKEFFGETCIPQTYFEQNFSEGFILDHFMENLTFDPNQACAVLRKK